MDDRFVSAFEEALAVNQGGEVRNLLITDNSEQFRSDALNTLKEWVEAKSFNLVMIDEKEINWIREIQTKVLFAKLNQPNTVLLIKNYTTVNFHSIDGSTPRNFLYDAVMNRHYGCNNDFASPTKLPNLMFVVAINDLSQMRWRKNEYSCFTIIHEDNEKKLWTNTSYCRPDSRMYPVMSAVNKVNYFVSEDRTKLCFDIRIAFGEQIPRRPIRFYTANERTEIIHTYLENNLPDFSDKVDCLILKMEEFDDHESFALDGARLKKSFPNLSVVCCKDSLEILNANDQIFILDPFELGELAFFLAQEGDSTLANNIVRDLWALDRRWARFFREVAVDFQCPREDHTKCYPNGNVAWTGLDNLFRIYMLGWYSKNDSFEENCVVRVTKHRNFDKALDLLAVRFKNWDIHEVAEKLYWDHMHVKRDKKPDYEQLVAVFDEAERLVPGVWAKMHANGW